VATNRDNLYGAFNFKVEFADVSGGGVIEAGFSDVSGLGNEIDYSEYRAGTDKTDTMRKVPHTVKLDEVTLKRGLVGSTDIIEWITAVREGAYQPRRVTIVMLDEARNEVRRIVLRNAQPTKWLGPTLAAKGGGEVAIEELQLVHEGIEYE
jgi:phage tail-like protein